MSEIAKIQLPDGSVYDIKDTIYTQASTSAAGLMSTADKTKLDSMTGGPLNIVDGSATGSIRQIGASTSLGSSAAAFGSASTAYGEASHAEGVQTYAYGLDSHAQGIASTASGNGSHSEGSYTKASGAYSHAEGDNTIASGYYGSHAEGQYTVASGEKSHAEGYGSTASNSGSHAEGHETQASGQYSHAEGWGSIASTHYAHAEGLNSTASGYSSHVQGIRTIASGDYQHVEGKYNVASTSYAHIVGNGASTSSRSNAYTLDWSGNGVFAGKVTLGSNAVNSMDAVTLAQLQNSAATYTQGSGIDISVDNQISVESNLSVVGDTAYLQYTTPSLAGCFIKKAHEFSNLTSSTESITFPISTYSGFTPIQILNYNVVTQNGNMIIQNMYITTDSNTHAPVAALFWFATRNNYGTVQIQKFTFDVLYINSDLLLQVT